MSGPILLPDATAGAGVTRTLYRRAVGRELGRHVVLQVSSEASTTTSADAGRQILCTTLGADQQMPSRFDHSYVYVVNGDQAGQVRKILSGTFDGADASILVDQPFSATLDAGTEIEISSPLPGSYHLDQKGLNQIVDEALALTSVEARITFDGNDTRIYSLIDFPYLTNTDWIKGIRDRRSGILATDPSPRSLDPFELNTNGATISLETGSIYTTADTFELVIIVNGDLLVKSGGAWAYAETPGLSGFAEDDDPRAAVPLHWVRVIGAMKALRACIGMAEDDETLSDAQRDRRIARYEQRLRTYARAGVGIQSEFPTYDTQVVRSTVGAALVQDDSIVLNSAPLTVSTLP